MNDKDIDLGPMEFFILALVAELHLDSLYSFRESAGLQPGAIRSALSRLEAGGLLARTEPGRRMRRAIEITAAGRELLSRHWRLCMRDYHDTESVIRAVTLASIMSNQQEAAAYLLRIAETRHIKAEDARTDSKRLEKMRWHPLSAYGWMRALTESHRREAECEAFQSIGSWLNESSSTVQPGGGDM